MINIWSITIENGCSLTVKTLSYEYPQSRVLLKYDVGRGEKIFHTKVDYIDGYLMLTCKHEIANKAKEILRRQYNLRTL